MTQPKNSKRELAHQVKLKEREDWHKLLVKVIIWKDGTAGNGIIKLTDKVSPREWKVYCQRIKKINILENDKVKLRLKEIRQKIKENGGFRG